MRDQQLAGLRRLFKPGAAQALAVAGLDAAPIALHLARALAADGARVLVVDREVGAIARHAGIVARFDLAQALDGDRRALDVLCDGPDGITVLPAARAFARLDAGDWQAPIAAVAARAGAFDHWIVHGGALAGVDTLCALAPAPESIPTCYAVLKQLARSRGTASIVAHGARSEQAARDAYRNVAATARRFLALDVALEAFVPGAPWPSPQLAPWASFAATAAGRAFADLAHRRAAPADAQAAIQG